LDSTTIAVVPVVEQIHKMSWQSYVDTNLVGTGYITKAAIIGIDDKRVWANSATLDLSPEELEAVATAFSDLAKVEAQGLRLEKEKFFTVKATADEIQLKRRADGACLYKTNRAIILGIYEAPIQQTECFAVVSTLGDYFKTVKY